MQIAVSLKREEISQDLGEEVANKLFDQLQNQAERRQENLRLNRLNSVKKEKLENLISTLENQVKILCK
jgi:signal recognition particle GTPase